MCVQCAAKDSQWRAIWQSTCGFTLERNRMCVQCAAKDFYRRAIWQATCGFTLERNRMGVQSAANDFHISAVWKHINSSTPTTTLQTQIWYEKIIFWLAFLFSSLNFVFCFVCVAFKKKKKNFFFESFLYVSRTEFFFFQCCFFYLWCFQGPYDTTATIIKEELI